MTTEKQIWMRHGSAPIWVKLCHLWFSFDLGWLRLSRPDNQEKQKSSNR